MEKRYYINTYGCQMNVHESEKLAGILETRGYRAAAEQDDADVIVFNTCCIRETAETHVLGNLGLVKKLKERRPEIVVAVCGCMAQKDGAAARLKKRCPFIDIIFGTHNLHRFGAYLDRLAETASVVDIWEHETAIVDDVPLHRDSGVNAWINIMCGCNNFCSYCIVPYVRGRERSRSIDSILAEAETLVKKYPQITLLGQNVNSYGNDRADGVTFSLLLQKICELPGSFRVGFMTSHPKDLSEEVVRTIAENEKMSRFIHLPVQAGSDRILHLMNRRYTSGQYSDKIKMIRDYLPDAGLSSDVMVGFPTETEADFADTLRLCADVRFNNLYTFIYSRRSGTPADKMEQVDQKSKKQRIRRLIEQQAEIATELAKEAVGKTFRVLCDTYVNGVCGGKTDCGRAIAFPSDVDRTGQFVTVRADRADRSKLFGVPINQMN